MESASVSRKEKRKALKKDKRKQIRKELAEKARAEEEARLNDPQVQREIQLEEEKEKERLERERKEFEERERVFLEELERKKKEEEEEQERMNAAEREAKLQLVGTEEGSNEDDDDEWEYVEEGPPEIIWQGNEIIVKKNKVKVKKNDVNQDIKKEDPNRPTSNPLPPQHEAYASFKNAPMTSAELLDTVAQQVPNFGTEQDKAHCPFHIKTGACRFGSHCNRVHYYPDKSNTLLIKNMYNGPGLAWEQDEGLEYTEEEVERSYEDFYEDVHTEFLKFGEIINFKVCRNGCFHLRGNVYVEYKSLDSAVMAYGSVHGRYFAGKQVKCEFVSLTRWKVAICGEYMKSRLKTCSRGSACNFLHCFSNPGGDYEWADSDKPPPRYWLNKMTALFGYSDQQHSSTIFTSDKPKHSYPSKRHRCIDNGSSRRSHRDETHARRHEHQKDHNVYQHESEYNINQMDTDSDRDSYHSKRHRSIEHNGSSSRGHHARKSRRQGDHNVYEEETEYKNKSSHPETDSDDRKRHDDRIRRTPYGTSSDEDHIYTKRKSRHRNNISESSSSNGAKTEHSEGKLMKTKSSRRDEESKKVEVRSRHRPRPRPSRRSHESEAKNDTSDRWQPHDYDDDDDRRTRSGGVVEDASEAVEHSDDRKGEKRKRI